MRRTRQNDVHLTEHLRLDFFPIFLTYTPAYSLIITCCLFFRVLFSSSTFYFQFCSRRSSRSCCLTALIINLLVLQTIRSLSFALTFTQIDTPLDHASFLEKSLHIYNCCSSILRYKTQGKKKERKTHTQTTRKKERS